ncbi:hypothetical protein [Undibacterium sp.]|uniref:hypothetical protein n=1 Tax=Undibacterium sp. TaxID=1914977 RepID=UPI002B79D960|nr:hypothetical protein [Undibacterium sp.]HTD03612.1 hypothetical protein [Undibacterium sp.]
MFFAKGGIEFCAVFAADREQTGYPRSVSRFAARMPLLFWGIISAAWIAAGTFAKAKLGEAWPQKSADDLRF